MLFDHTETTLDNIRHLKGFMQEHVYPLEGEYRRFTDAHPWRVFPRMEKLKDKARAAGLWNLFLPEDYGDFSPGLTNLQYAPLAEIMGRVLWASEIFNCSAPDTGNMEVLAKYGTPEQQRDWLLPLLDGQIRSAFLMTEPGVASSDATNIETRIDRDGDDYIINGRKWWSTGAMHPDCRVYVVMGKTNPEAPRHQQQSMILVPADTPGVNVVRPLTAFGTHDSPHGHAEIQLTNVRVPATNLLLGEGRGFEIAQGRLGPGRIHHCMRLIGVAQRSLELACARVGERTVFGRELSKFSSVRQEVARSRCEIEQARLLTLSAADRIDRHGIKGAKDLVAMIKIVCPQMACTVVDRAIQLHGGLGVSSDLPLAEFYAYARSIRLADGPDEVHMYQLGRNTIGQYAGVSS
ncbi:acyl-CoA dehydrogenase family protein [Neolewinella litorea]|uniref:Acyl-CoA dehydrogenase n=1 Tax=Neolewinella litorea TaxID=2562452 RepID=A0A4S4NJQ8_9BACT|nr:acyl-CoA dehydrogenase family protein [Neolewinella litorea]THH40044.1 acyl-CoA dehydrogenase [Neolewinella litorea]